MKQAGGAEQLLGPSFPAGVVGATTPEDEDEDDVAAAGGIADVPSPYNVTLATR